MKKNIFYLGIIFILIMFILRLNLINEPIYQDEFDFLNGLDYYFQEDFPCCVPYHGPMWYIIFKPFFLLSEGEPWGGRLAMFLCGILIILFSYKIALNVFNKKTAFLTVFILSSLFWFALSNMMIDIDGGILSLFIILSMHYFIKYDTTQKFSYLLLTSFFISLGLLTKFTAVLIIGVVFFYILLKEGFVNSFKKTLIISLISFLIFSIFPLWSYTVGQDIFTRTFSYERGRILSFIPSIKPIIFMFVWGTPFLIFMIWLIFKDFRLNNIEEFEKPSELSNSSKRTLNKNHKIRVYSKFSINKKHIIYFYLMSFLVFSFFIKGVSLDRLLIPVIPYFAILSADYISRLKWRNSEIKLFFLCSIIFTVSYFFLSLLKYELLIHDYLNYFLRALSFKWLFYLPIRGTSGPMLVIPFLLIAITLILSFLFFIIFIITKKLKWFSLFLAICLALNFYTITEYSLHITTPNIGRTVNQLADYITLKDIKVDKFSANIINLIRYKKEPLKKDNMLATDFSGIIAYLDFHKIDSPVKNCKEIIKFSDKEYYFSYLFNCTSS